MLLLGLWWLMKRVLLMMRRVLLMCCVLGKMMRVGVLKRRAVPARVEVVVVQMASVQRVAAVGQELTATA